MPANNQLNNFLNNPANRDRINDLNINTTSSNDAHDIVDKASHRTHQVIDNVNNTAHGIKNNVESKLNDISYEVHKEYIGFSTDFANHNITIKNHNYDYSTLAKGAAIATLGLTYVGEQALATAADLYRTASSLVKGEFSNSMSHAFDAASHSAVALATYVFNDVVTSSGGNAQIAKTVEDISGCKINTATIAAITGNGITGDGYGWAQIAGTAIGLLGAGEVGYDVIYHDENI